MVRGNSAHIFARRFERLWCVYWKSVWAFQVSASLSRSSSQRCSVRMRAQMSPWRTYWTCVGVPRGSASLVLNPGVPDGTLERSLVRAWTTVSNRRRSTKVSFSNIYVILCNMVVTILIKTECFNYTVHAIAAHSHKSISAFCLL